MPRTTFPDLVRVMHRLRRGCPWDRKQTHASLLKYLREESEEACQAVEKRDWDNLAEELGDVLLQVLFHAELAAEKKRFTIHDVLHTLKTKLVRRHPHVFSRRKADRLQTPEQVKLRWAEIKAMEKREKAKKNR